MRELLAEYPIVIEVPVVWGEQDAFGHVNNVFYFRWCESARIHYGERLGFLKMHREQNIGPIVAQLSCNFRKPVLYPDTVSVGARVTRIGRTSMVMEHLIVSPVSGVVADASSVLVLFDYNLNKPQVISASLRQIVSQMEQRDFSHIPSAADGNK